MHAEGVPLERIADAVGTPVYVYSRATLTRHARVFRQGLAGVERAHFAYAIKANPNLAVLKVLADEGYGAEKPPTAQELLKPSNQARPARSDELLRSSEERRSDDYDLPPN